jgi:hypothetical protein
MANYGCVYVAVDQTRADRCKVGFSSRPAHLRIAEASNPDYVLYYEHVTKYARDLERIVHKVLTEASINRIRHASGGISEWFDYPAAEARRVIQILDCCASRISLHPIGREFCSLIVHQRPSLDEAVEHYQNWLEKGRIQAIERTRLREEEFNNDIASKFEPYWMRLLLNLFDGGSWNHELVLDEAIKQYLIHSVDTHKNFVSEQQRYVSDLFEAFKITHQFVWSHNPKEFILQIESQITAGHRSFNKSFLEEWSEEGALAWATKNVKLQYQILCLESSKQNNNVECP